MNMRRLLLTILCAFVSAPSIVEAAPQIKKLPTSETQAPTFGTQAEEAPAAEAAPAAAAPAKEAPAAATTATKVSVPAKKEGEKK